MAASTIEASQIQEHSKVVGSDGEPVGVVDHVEDGRIKLTKNDSPDGQHHFLPIASIASVDGTTVKLGHTAAEAKKAWQSA